MGKASFFCLLARLGLLELLELLEPLELLELLELLERDDPLVFASTCMQRNNYFITNTSNAMTHVTRINFGALASRGS